MVSTDTKIQPSPNFDFVWSLVWISNLLFIQGLTSNYSRSSCQNLQIKNQKVALILWCCISADFGLVNHSQIRNTLVVCINISISILKFTIKDLFEDLI